MPEGPRPRTNDDAPPVPPIGEDDVGDDAPGDEELPASLADEPLDDLLDDRTGESDEIEWLEDAVGSEDGWVADSDPDESEPEDESTATDAEYGWTEDTEAAGTDEWEDDLVSDSDPKETTTDADAGDEGLEEAEVEDPSELEPAPLEEFDETDDETDDPDVLDEATEEEPAWLLPPAADPSTVLVHHLGPSDQAVSSVAALGDEIWAAGSDAFAAHGDHLLRVDDPALEGVEVQSVALVPGAGGPVVALGTVVGGCLVRRTGLGAFERANGWTAGPPHSTFFVSSCGTELLGRTSDGRLFRSADAGATWVGLEPGGRVLGAAISAERIVAVVVPAGAAPALAQSQDGGSTFTTVPLLMPRGARVGSEIFVSVSGASILLTAEEIGSALHSADGGMTFERWTCPVALAGALDPNDPAIAYLSLFHAARDEGALAVTRDAGRSFVTLAEMSQLRRAFRLEERGDSDGDNRIHAVVVDRAPGRVYLASAAGVFALAVRPA